MDRDMHDLSGRLAPDRTLQDKTRPKLARTSVLPSSLV